LNHKKQKFNISGLASDANTAVDQVYIKIYKIDENGYLEIDDDGAPIAAITDNNATGYFSNIQFADYVKDSEGNITGIRGGYLLLMPADEEIFEIDANTRAISIPSKVKKNGIGVYGDHNAEMIVLNIDRYFDS
jgi:hypothetical protein